MAPAESEVFPTRASRSVIHLPGPQLPYERACILHHSTSVIRPVLQKSLIFDAMW